jgi:hypothetical protein
LRQLPRAIAATRASVRKCFILSCLKILII